MSSGRNDCNLSRFLKRTPQRSARSSSLLLRKHSETQPTSSTESLLKMHSRSWAPGVTPIFPSCAWRGVLLYPKIHPRLMSARRSTLIMLYRHAFPALIPSGLEHEPAPTRLHTLQKSMSFRTTAIIRLVRPLRHFLAPSKTLNLTQKAAEKACDIMLSKNRQTEYQLQRTGTTKIDHNRLLKT